MTLLAYLITTKTCLILMIARKTHHEFTPGLVNNTDMKSIREEGLEGVLSSPPLNHTSYKSYTCIYKQKLKLTIFHSCMNVQLIFLFKLNCVSPICNTLNEQETVHSYQNSCNLWYTFHLKI